MLIIILSMDVGSFTEVGFCGDFYEVPGVWFGVDGGYNVMVAQCWYMG